MSLRTAPSRFWQRGSLSALWLLMLTLALPVAAQSPLPDTIERVRPAIVGIGTARPARQPLAKGPPTRFTGTGFAVGDGLTIVTNFHVLFPDIDTENRETLAVFTGRGRETQVRPARLLRSLPERDLALLRIEGEPLPVLPLGDDSLVREGSDIAFTGFPIGVVLGLHPVTHRGIIAAITPIVIPAQSARQLSPQQLRALREPQTVYQLDATAYPGNSGSPVYTVDGGVVIGILNSVHIKETKESVLEKPSGISYAIPVSQLRALLAADD
jgi:serine protease Do